jgi:hypothetical protein
MLVTKLVEGAHRGRIMGLVQERLERAPTAVDQAIRIDGLRNACRNMVAKRLREKSVDVVASTGKIGTAPNIELADHPRELALPVVENLVIDDEGSDEVAGVALCLEDVGKP